MSRPSLREDILEGGLRVMFRSGYHGASVRDICVAAGAPHGSFTNHFRSKEAFAAEVLERYFDYLKGLARASLQNEKLTPRQRLKQYLDIITDKLERDGWKVGCLVGDFSLGTSSHSRVLRERLNKIFQEWRKPFASCIAAAQAAGEIDAQFEAAELAEFLLTSWQGAILRMKVERGPAALERFKTIVFETVFKSRRTSNVSRPGRGPPDRRTVSRRSGRRHRKQPGRSKS
jgi:TetR/AcrR family transcriptional regulator, transcriptional repressor for nem operon